MDKMNFVWILGSGSMYSNNEIRYSIRSVLKFHPDAEIVIVGEKPDWYTGRHYYVPDNSISYVNAWRKIEKGCELFDEFIKMDDDFYLNEPFKKQIYKLGRIRAHARTVRGQGIWGKVVIASYKRYPTADRYCLHVPYPVKSDVFMEIANNHPERLKPPSLVPRQIYCHLQKEYPVVDIKADVKTKKTINPDGLPFFSISDNFLKNRNLFDKLYPNKSPFEKF